MSRIRVICEGREDRIAPLKTGQVAIGSGLSCDVVVFGPGVDNKHIVLTIYENEIRIEAAGRRPVIVQRAKQGLITLDPGDTNIWMPGDMLEIGSISIVLEDVALKPVSPDLSDKKKGNARSSRSLGSAFFFVCLTIIIVGGFGFMAIVGTTRPAEANLSVDPDPVIDASTVTSDFQNAGFGLEAITKTTRGFQVSAYVGSVQEQSEFADFIAHLPYHVDHHVYVENRLHSAVSLVLENTGHDTEVISIKRGQVELRGIADTNQQSRIVRAIKDDVPGITDVVFATFDAEQASRVVTKEIAGVWYGAHSYVFMKDGRIVRPGDTLSEEITLLSVISETDLMISNGQQDWSLHWHD